MTTFDLQTGQVVQVGTNGVSRSGTSPDRNNFAPRVGFAWSPARGLVIRGGYGIYYDAGYFEVQFGAVLQSAAVYAPGVLPDPEFASDLGGSVPSRRRVCPTTFLEYAQPGHRRILHAALEPERSAHFRLLGHAEPGVRRVQGNASDQCPRSQPACSRTRRSSGAETLPEYGSILFMRERRQFQFPRAAGEFQSSISHGISLWGVYSFSKSIDGASAFQATKAGPEFSAEQRESSGGARPCPVLT